jgi:tRNA pseudouridine38-40 synthase
MQRQADARTVQGELEEALRKIGWQGSSILVAGRTDAGVHAAGQVVAFDLDWGHSSQDLCNALNANLPPDIGAQGASRTVEDFHPRFDAISRTYRYQIICREHRDPIRERYAWRLWPSPDFARLEASAGEFMGERDFSAFGTPPHEGGTTTRSVLESSWHKGDASLLYEVSANAYLYHMVRRMVHVQVEIGLGRSTIAALRDYLSGHSQEMIQGLAPAHGLFLQKVSYPE